MTTKINYNQIKGMIFNILDYGVNTTPGTTDMTSAFTAAFAAIAAVPGGTLFIPQGTYLITSSVTIPSYCIIQGDGGNTVIYMNGTATQFTTSSLTVHSSIRDIAIYGPLRSGGPGVSTVAAVKWNSSNFMTVMDCEIKYFAYGVQMKILTASSSFSNQIYRTDFNCTINCIQMESGSNACTIQDCTFSGCVIGMFIEDCNNTTIIGGVCEGASGSVFYIDSTTGVNGFGTSIIGFHIESSGSTAGQIRIGPTANVEGVNIIGCFFKGNSTTDYYPIVANKVSSLTVLGCAMASGGGQYTGGADINYGTVTKALVNGNASFTYQQLGVYGKKIYSTVPIGSVAYSSFGTNANLGSGALGIASLQVVESAPLVTGVKLLNGATVGTDKVIYVLYDAVGTVVRTTALAGTTTAGANAFQTIAFTSTITNLGPGTYFIGVQINGGTDTQRYVAANTFVDVLTVRYTPVFGTITAQSPTPTTTFTADVGPIAYLY